MDLDLESEISYPDIEVHYEVQLFKDGPLPQCGRDGLSQ